MTNVERMMTELTRLTRDAGERLIKEVEPENTDEIVRLLGGSFRKSDEIHMQGGHTTTVLVGKNRREAVISATNGRVDGAVRVFEPRVRRIK